MSQILIPRQVSKDLSGLSFVIEMGAIPRVWISSRIVQSVGGLESFVHKINTPELIYKSSNSLIKKIRIHSFGNETVLLDLYLYCDTNYDEINRLVVETLNIIQRSLPSDSG